MDTISNTKKATRKEWIGLAVIALPCMLYSMDLTVLNLAVPKLSAVLNPTGQQLLWIVDIYGFLLAGFLITMGTIGDRIGRRKLFMIGATAFGFASLLAAFSNTPEVLIAARALLGIAGATLAPSTLSLIRNMFLDDKERTTAIAIWITSFSLGGAIGPFVGGVLLEYYWWGSVFLVAVPVMILLLTLAPFLLPEHKNPAPGKIDLPSALLSLGMILAMIYGIKNISQGGLSLLPSVSIVMGFFLGLLFIKRQQKLFNPFLDLGLFRIPAFSVSLCIYMLSTFVLFGMFFFIAQYLQLVLGLSPIRAGLCTLPSSVGFIIGSMTVPKLSEKFQPTYLIILGLLVAAIGFVLLTNLGSNDLVKVVISITLFSLGIAPVFTLSTDMIVGSAPPESAGMASSLAETTSELGGALGIAILGSLGSFIYLREINENAVGLYKTTGTFGGDVANATNASS
jgi:MFS transporter, DHA2 family, multidrug resistance protein